MAGWLPHIIQTNMIPPHPSINLFEWMNWTYCIQDPIWMGPIYMIKKGSFILDKSSKNSWKNQLPFQKQLRSPDLASKVIAQRLHNGLVVKKGLLRSANLWILGGFYRFNMQLLILRVVVILSQNQIMHLLRSLGPTQAIRCLVNLCEAVP